MNTVANTALAHIRGFNYQPSYASSGFEIWQIFDSGLIETEVARGKRHFPGMNALRVWLSWDSYGRSPDRFRSRFETMLAICGKYELAVMPCLFNRWHDPVADYGGIYTDHFLTGADNLINKGSFRPYMEAVVGEHRDDPRIFCWDLCNEPYHCKPELDPAIMKAVEDAESSWLVALYDICKELGATAPVSVGVHGGKKSTFDPIERLEPVSDVLNVHAYCFPGGDRAAFEARLDWYVDLANRTGKALVVGETCWGHLDNAVRAELVRYTLGQLKERGIGYLTYLLQHSLVPDAHWPGYGHVHDGVGTLHFVEPDGSIRPGHEAWNEV